MSTTETVRSAAAVLKALDAEVSGGDLRKIGDYLADDFKFIGVADHPLSKAETIGLWTAIRAALPDFNHNLSSVREAYNIVYATVEVTGTHTGTLNAPGGISLPPTGRTLHNPAERVAVTVRNGRVTEWVVEHVPGGGFAGVLGQLA
ncbi:MAG TPA: ester cyclase [Dehalococcoidia bacterium]|nr:ester cyclase [Dehalococcoidia bacterium]